mgnify:FL=1
MDAELLRKSLDDFIGAWEKFLLDQIDTVELTDALIRHMKVVDTVAPESDEDDLS